MKAVCLQLWLEEGESKEERIKRVERMIDRAADADLIVLPELWNIGWYSFDKYHEYSESLPGETISRIAAKAKAVNAYILAGTIIEKRNELFYNTAVFLNANGEIIAKYSKTHIPSMAGPEKDYITRGEEIVTANTELGVFGFGICYDLRFPELYRKMAIDYGVQIFLQTSAWPLVRVENYMDLCHARATENQCYFISCNCAGFDHGKQYLGHSTIVDPYGISIASAGLFESVVSAEIYLTEVQNVRKMQPCFSDIVDFD